ncbi:MAG: hypothetical protein M3Q56_09625 [Bacteroidota bacterium]|nr:hypothetical protein [Bacteroidota bacterium]
MLLLLTFIITTFGDADVEYLYTASQQRLSKIVKPHKVAGAGISDQDQWTYYWYAYDAGGQVMAVYKQTYEDKTAGVYKIHLDVQEHDVYGSGRLGIRKGDDDGKYEMTFTGTKTSGVFSTLLYSGASASLSRSHFVRELGSKQYEVANHLGNVLVTVSDKRLGYMITPVAVGTVDWYVPDVMSYTDYYVFGAPQPGRAGGDPTRYGFNGMESDDNMKGDGLDYTTEYRQYDPRVGRWFSPDEIVKHFESPYASMTNNPVVCIDPDGLDAQKGPIKDAIDKVDRKLGKIFGRSRLFGFYGSNRRLVDVSETRRGSFSFNQTRFTTPSRANPLNTLADIQSINALLNGTLIIPGGIMSNGFAPIMAAAAMGVGVVAPQIIYSEMAGSLTYNSFFQSPSQQFFLDRMLLTDNAGNSIFPDAAGLFMLTVNIGISNHQYMGSSALTPGALPGAILNDRFNIRTQGAGDYRMTYTKIPIFANSKTGPYISGYQFAPPNTPGAKPLWKHSARYIVRYIFGGARAVDLNNAQNRSKLRTHNN